MGMGSERTRDPMFEQSPDEWDRARVCALTCRARARVAASVCVCVCGGWGGAVHARVHTAVLLVEIGPEGWTPTQQPPEFSPSLRSLSPGFYFYLCEERKC
jgi:hypothetical protein